MALGVYLISDIDFLVKQGQDLQDYQEIVLSDIYHPATIFLDQEAQQQQQQQQLSRAHLEQTISKHQLVILDHSRHLGLKRGNSDPELHCSNSMVNLSEGLDDHKIRAPLSASSAGMDAFSHVSDDGQGAAEMSNERKESDAVPTSARESRHRFYWLSMLSQTINRRFGVSGTTSLSNVPANPLSVIECKVQDTEHTKQSSPSHQKGCWDCEAGDATESTDKDSYGSSHISSSDGSICRNDDWVCDVTERNDDDKIYDA
jgi:hypothetical protein